MFLPIACLLVTAKPAPQVTLQSLLAEMSDPAAVARFPSPVYDSLQASSYNRQSVKRGEPGWFADSDGTGFIRAETIGGNTEWVIMEHSGPGCITKLWTPFFYYDFNERVGPHVRIYLDGSKKPVIDESLIELVSGKGSFRPPFASFTARAGDSYQPIPFAQACKITLTGKPFYNIVDYRAYPPGTKVETFSFNRLRAASRDLEKAAKRLIEPEQARSAALKVQIKPGATAKKNFPKGPSALQELEIRIPQVLANPALLRSVVLALTFDGEETVWCPIGDFFCSADALHPFKTFQREVREDGTFICRWVMPYRKLGELRLINLSSTAVEATWQTSTSPRKWDDRSMHFYARWRPDDIVPGTPFQDWNFIDIHGQGVYVGDAWTVLNMQRDTWWGEGDEKIYVDGAWDRGFPTHFGTGSEDYYGWAGGVLPTRQDEFSTPFLANVRVGGLDGHTLGYNICTRTRSLDAIPFSSRLRFDMESSFGVDIRNPWNLLGYSAVTFFYAKPGATHNRPALPEQAAKPIVNLHNLQKRSAEIKGGLHAQRPEVQTNRRTLARPRGELLIPAVWMVPLPRSGPDLRYGSSK